MKEIQILHQRNGAAIATYMGGDLRCLTITDKRLEARNFSLAELYLRSIAGTSIKRVVTEKHIVMDVPQSLKDKLILTTAEASKMNIEQRMEWYKMNAYCVQIESDLDKHTKYALMYAHLTQCFRNLYGITGEYKEIKTKCLSLTFIEEKNIPVINFAASSAEDSIAIVNGKVDDFIYLVNDHPRNFLPLPVVDETRWEGDVIIQIGTNLSDPDAINKQLEIYNLRLVEAERNVKMLVISTAD